MAAVMTTTRGHLGYRADPTIRSRPRPSTATYRRRRVAAAGLALVIVLVAAQAGGALGDSPLAVSERRPASSASSSASGRISYVVQQGDSLWSIAEELAPGEDPRPVVDALAEARGDAPLIPGETIVWPG
ncbi:MAG: LysM peptidoglycan-binding domain-containing protein [Actinomycetota bacterium]